jgi:ketosteroid isomerase-like protein
MTASNQTPTAIFHRLLDAIGESRWSGLADLYADDAIVELPFAIPSPIELRGKAAIRAHFEQASRAPFDMRVKQICIHETNDPELIFGEFEYELRHRDSGKQFDVANIQRIRVRRGQIVHSRDYHDHHAIQRAIMG